MAARAFLLGTFLTWALAAAPAWAQPSSTATEPSAPATQPGATPPPAAQAPSPGAQAPSPVAPGGAALTPSGGPEATQPPGVLAEVEGVPVTAKEVTQGLEGTLNQLEQQMYELKQRRLDELIEQRLLEREAARRGLSVSSLLDAEVTTKVSLVTEAEIDSFYAANQARIKGPLASVRERIRTYLQTQKLTARRHEFVRGLRSTAHVVVYLEPPPVFRARISTDGAAVRGPASAPVTIVEFSDFYCPYCRQAQPVLARLHEQYGDKVRLVYKNLPIEKLHAGATKAAEAAQCAKEQGKFWEYHDKLFGEAPNAASDALNAWAAELGLDAARFEQCLSSRKYQAVVQQDIDEAMALGANFTPAFFVNGRMLQGAQPLEAFVRIIDEELKRQP